MITLLKKLKAEVGFGRRRLRYMRYYRQLNAHLKADNQSSKAFQLPDIKNRLSGETYIKGYTCHYYDDALMQLADARIVRCSFIGCNGKWPIYLVQHPKVGYSAEPQLDAISVASLYGQPVANDSPETRVREEVFSILGPHDSNWYHSVIEQLSLVLRWESQGLREKGVKLAAPDYWRHRWPDLLETIGVENNEIIWIDEPNMRFDKVWLAISSQARPRSLWPTNVARQQFANPNDVRKLRTKILEYLTSRDLKPNRRIIIDRNDSWKGSRNLHFSELADVLVAQYNFEKVLLGVLSPLQQFALFNQSAFVVAEHGAGLTSFIAASEQTHLIEILPRRLDNVGPHGFNFISKTIEHKRYHTLVDEPLESTLSYITGLLDN